MSSGSTMKLWITEGCKNVFRCDICDEHLRPPVKFAGTIGPMCQQCFAFGEENYGWKSDANPKLDSIINQIIPTCSNNECSKQVAFAELKRHQERCEHRIVECLAIDCEWKGALREFYLHFCLAHSNDIVLNKTDSRFIIRVGSEPLVKLLVSRQAYFIKICMDSEEKVWCSFFEFGSVRFEVATIGLTNGNLEPIELLTLPSFCIDLINFDKVHYTDLSNLVAQANNSRANPVELTVKVDDAHDEIQFLLKTSQLFCTVCKTLMTPPIYQCSGGHSSCENCTMDMCSKGLECTECKVILTSNIRNYGIECFYTMEMHFTKKEKN